MEELREPKRKKRRRFRLKKLNPFRRKYKKFSEEDGTNNGIEVLDGKKTKKKSRAKGWLNTVVGVITFKSARRNGSTSNPISTRTRSRTRYSSTGSLECLVTQHVDLPSDSDELQPKKARKRAHSDPCLYQVSKDQVQKKKSKKKRVKKVGMQACKLVGTGMVQAAGMFQYMSPVAGVPTAVNQGLKPKARPKATYYNNDRDRSRYKTYSDMQYNHM